MGDNPDSNWLADYRPQLRISEVGKLVAIGDGIARIEGLPSAAMDEILRFADGSEALVFDLGSKRIGAILLNQREGLAAGSSAQLTGRRLDIGVGDGFLGRVVDPLGHPLDGGLPVEFSRRRALEVSSPPITARDFVERPLLSGNKMVDTMIPIGKGQRQLIIGDAGTGKSSLALDTIIAQQGRNVLCVYVLISQKRSAVVATIETLRQTDEPGAELCILIGSEQGFCGDFNESLLSRMETLCQQKSAPPRWLVVGRRLASCVGERDCVELALPGATVADEVPAVLLHLTKELSRLLAQPALAGFGLAALYHCAATNDIRLRRLLPLRDLPSPEHSQPYPAELNLPPEAFLRGLTGHYLHAVLNEVLYSSLMAENRQRQLHMDSALQRLDEDSARLKLTYNIQRQEEITEEIEVILLSADMLHEAEHGG